MRGLRPRYGLDKLATVCPACISCPISHYLTTVWTEYDNVEANVLQTYTFHDPTGTQSDIVLLAGGATYVDIIEPLLEELRRVQGAEVNLYVPSSHMRLAILLEENLFFGGLYGTKAN